MRRIIFYKCKRVTLELFWVVDDDMDAHLHLCLLKGEVEAGDFCLSHLFRHLLGGESAIERVSVDQLSFLRAFPVRLQDVDRLDRIPLDTLLKHDD